MQESNKIAKIITYTTVFSIVISSLSIRGFSDAISINLFKVMSLSDFFNYSIEILLNSDVLLLMATAVTIVILQFLKNKLLITISGILLLFMSVKAELIYFVLLIIFIYIKVKKMILFELIMTFLKEMDNYILIFLICVSVMSYLFGYRSGYNLKNDNEIFNVTVISEEQKIQNVNLIFTFNNFVVIKEKNRNEIKIINRENIKELKYEY